MTAPVTSCGCILNGPLRIVESDLQVQTELGRLLEEIADSLPHRANHSRVRAARDILNERIPYFFDFRTACLFPMLRKKGDPGLSEVLDRTEPEYLEDRHYAEEIVEIFDHFLSTDEFSNPESFGYMLRSVFATSRRRIAWEKDYLLPRTWQVLAPADLQELQQWLQTNAPPACSGCTIARIRKILAPPSSGGQKPTKQSIILRPH